MLPSVAILMGDNGVGAPDSSSAELPDLLGREVPEPAPSGATVITETFSLVSQAGDKAVAYFYGRLFAENPRLRELFPAAMDAQRDRLFDALTKIVCGLAQPDVMQPYLAQLGRSHRKYGVQAEHYPAVGSALLATLRRFSGPAWTPAAESAWATAYGQAAQLMTAAAAQEAELSPPWWPAEVVGHELRARDLAVLTVQPDEPFHYQAGQYVSLQSVRWHRVWRPFSVANAPRPDGRLSFHVRAVPGGWVSSALVQYTAVGDRVNLGPPQGGLTRPAGAGDMFCVAGGTGLAPIKALIEHAIADSAPDRRPRIRLLLGARREADFYDLPDLWNLEGHYPWLRIITAVSDDPGYRGVQGMLPDIVARQLPNADEDVYLSGPPAMVEKTIRVLSAPGLPRWRVHADPLDIRHEL